MNENNSDRNVGIKANKQCNLNLPHDISASFSVYNSRHGDRSVTDRLVQNAVLHKNDDKAVFEIDLTKLKQEMPGVEHCIRKMFLSANGSCIS